MKLNLESVWTLFWDMHSGGDLKEKWDSILIEAPEEMAKLIFYNRFGHDPNRVTCTCCSDDYSSDSGTLLQVTEEYVKRDNVLCIPDAEVKPEWKRGEIHRSGYMWVD